MERIGPYEVHEQLGRGGMGSVFRAVDPRSGQEVALKVLGVTDPRARQRLVLEARALARLRHPNIVSFLDAGEDRGRPWIAIELVRGGSLEERLEREGPLQPRDAARIVLSLAVGLSHAHALGVLHRDMKPANVLLPDGGEAKLTDFGLAGFEQDEGQGRLTKSGTFMGSPGYWSPEQAAGRRSAIGQATDVYGLGGVLYAALTGRPPLEGDSTIAILHATEFVRPPPPGVDRALDALALRCLEKRPEARCASAEEVARELARYLSGRPARRRRRRLVAGLAIAAVATSVAGLAWGLSRLVASPPAPVAASPVAAPASSPRSPATTPAYEPASTAPSTSGREPKASSGTPSLIASARERLARGDVAHAIADLDRAIELDPRGVVAHRERGMAKERLGDHAGAIKDLDRAIELDPGDVLAYANRGVSRSNAGDLQGALADCDKTLELRPAGAGGHVNRGLVRAKLGRHAAAVDDYEAALRLEPGASWAAQVSGWLAEARAKLPDEAPVPGELRARVDALLASADARFTRDDLQGAIDDCTRAIELDPDVVFAHVNRGGARDGLGDLPGAIEDYEAALRLQPDASWAAQVRGWLADARARLAR